MAEWEQLQLVPFDADGGGSPVVLVGRLLASDSTRHVNGPNRHRWIECRVFEMKDGKVAVELDYATRLEGEQSYNRVAVFDDLDAVPERPDYDADPCHALGVWITDPVRVQAEHILGRHGARSIQ
jgi:hypothetical protein